MFIIGFASLRFVGLCFHDCGILVCSSAVFGFRVCAYAELQFAHCVFPIVRFGFWVFTFMQSGNYSLRIVNFQFLHSRIRRLQLAIVNFQKSMCVFWILTFA